MLGPGGFQAGCQFLKYDPVAKTLTNTANPANCPVDPTFVGHLFNAADRTDHVHRL